MSVPTPTAPEGAVSSNDTAEWLALNRTPGIGSRGMHKLLQHFTTPGNAFAADREQLAALGLPAAAIEHLKQPDWTAVETDLAWLRQPDNRLIRITDAAYPPLLAAIADPPPLLFVHGDADYLLQPQLAVVGSRNPSRDGIALAEDFSAYLSACGLTICSGLAAGIDAAAHRGALRGAAGTVAVTGTGLDRVYPAQHRELAHLIAADGALVSEFAPGTPPLASNFPRRNRIISGLGMGTLVVEAALRSGSLITARQALEQGREVFAIPGSIHNPLARGCHALIRQGAKLVESGADILEELTGRFHEPPAAATDAQPAAPPSVGAELAGEYRDLLDAMGYEPVCVDQLVARSGLTPEEVSSMLLLLELEDKVHSSAGGRYTRNIEA
jgi:DNA processing protein